MLFSTALIAVLPLLATAVPAKRENWGKEHKPDHKEWSDDKSHDKSHDDWKHEKYHASADKDWKPYFRPSPAPKYKVPEWKYDKEFEYADASAWFNDYKVENFPGYWTSAAVAYATPDTIINNNQTSVPGLPGGLGTFAFGLNSDLDTICYNITVYITGNYSSPAKTATHIHQAAVGAAGPPRLAFPNPEPRPAGEEDSHWEDELTDLELRYSYGCLKGPFTTGLAPNGTDSAAGFTIADLEYNPSAFFADTHTAQYTAGAIRGQLRVVKPTWEYKEEDKKY